MGGREVNATAGKAVESGGVYGIMRKRKTGEGETTVTICEDCLHYDYDEEEDVNFCNVDLDEDEMERFLRGDSRSCPFYHRGDDYRTARRQ